MKIEVNFMPKPTSGKQIKSINFDKDVLKALENKCKKDNTNVSTFVNFLVRRVILSDYEYYREKAKQFSIKLSEYQFLMDTSPDKPIKGG